MKIIADPQAAVDRLEQIFVHILHNNMQGIPILNNHLAVQTLGFQVFDGRIIGIIITPWLMNLIMLPNKQDDWSKLQLGDKMPVKFPSAVHKFMVNEIDGIGKCKTCSLYSPMHEFSSQTHALTVAQDFINALLVARDATVEELVDEDLLGRIMRGEDIDVNLDEFAALEPLAQPAAQPAEVSVIKDNRETFVSAPPRALSRRDLIRGKFLRS